MTSARATSRDVTALLAVALLLTAPDACTCGSPALPPGSVAVDGFAAITPIDTRSVVLSFSTTIDKSTVTTSAFSVADYTVVPPHVPAIATAEASGDAEVTLTAGDAFVAGATYTVVVNGVRSSDGRDLSGTLNFIAPPAATSADATTVTFVIDDVETARAHSALTLLVTLDEDGAFAEELRPIALVDGGNALSVTVPALVAPSRTLDVGDDADAASDRRSFAALVMDDDGRLASSLVRFEVRSDAPVEVPIDVLPPLEIVDQPTTDPLPEAPVDDAIGDGRKVVRVVVDDRAARELTSPQLKLSFNDDGAFDATFPRTVALTAMSGDFAGFWEATVHVAVDAARTPDGTSPETFPYFAFLVEAGTPYEALSVSITAPDETPQTVRLSLGDPDYTPVTFRVDASRAYLDPAGSERGVRAGEAVFLTGEWQVAVDALGNNCGDAFSGGEQGCLQMRPLAGHPGVWTRTIWLPPGRPYGWKVVRCPSTTGCGPLNQLVASAGRAFATVMKNLATDNVDAFADPNVGLVDPIDPAHTVTGTTTRDYTNAAVYEGTGVGSEPDPAGTPDGARMFKQEVPDLVVVVADQPIRTRVIHVGTWRDVNLGKTPDEIVQQQLSVQLNPADYDDGFIGRFPPSRQEP